MTLPPDKPMAPDTPLPKRASQLPLDLRIPRPDAGGPPRRAASNDVAFDMIARWPDWPNRWLCLVGPEGSGKSRLARHFAGLADAPLIAASDFAAIDPVSLGAEPALVLEDVDRGGYEERALFHLLNAALAAGGSILLTARRPGWAAGLATPDLASRLKTAPTVAIGPPDDELLAAVLTAEFAERQLAVDPPVIDYLLLRMERSLHEAVALVDRLDRHALASQRRITRPLAAEILATHPAFDGDADTPAD